MEHAAKQPESAAGLVIITVLIISGVGVTALAYLERAQRAAQAATPRSRQAVIRCMDNVNDWYHREASHTKDLTMRNALEDERQQRMDDCR